MAEKTLEPPKWQATHRVAFVGGMPMEREVMLFETTKGHGFAPSKDEWLGYRDVAVTKIKDQWMYQNLPLKGKVERIGHADKTIRKGV